MRHTPFAKKWLSEQRPFIPFAKPTPCYVAFHLTGDQPPTAFVGDAIGLRAYDYRYVVVFTDYHGGYIAPLFSTVRPVRPLYYNIVKLTPRLLSQLASHNQDTFHCLSYNPHYSKFKDND